MKHLYATVGVLAVLALIFAISGSVVSARNALTLLLSDFLIPARASIGEVFGQNEISELAALRAENERLRARILTDSSAPLLVSLAGRKAIAAKIYSAYPFNNRALVSINAGTREGAQAGMPVLAEDVFLFGRVTEVFDGYSVVRTIFDSGWELPVKIGSSGFDALLVGGRDPRLTLMVKEADIKDGDEVWSVGRDFPYGLTVGTVVGISENDASAFREAALEVPYETGALSGISVLL